MDSIFKDWKCRASSLGYILTNRPGISKNQLEEIKSLSEEKTTGLNRNGNKVKWSPTKEAKLKNLINSRDAPDVLPKGVKTHLDNVFRGKFWKRKRLLFNKYLDKGNIAEEDGLELVSEIDGFFYAKNREYFENNYICGTPDNVQDIVRDIKSNWDKESFDNAELTALYKWQVRAYLWLLMKHLKAWKGELIYCLVNNPVHQLLNDKTSLWYKMGTPDDDDERYIEALSQIERNMVFDIQKFKKNYPNYDFISPVLDFDIPPICRIKRFDVVLRTQDIKFIKQRVKMSREYLINKEKEELEKINSYQKTA